MSELSAERLSKIPRRFYRDLKLIRLLQNWPRAIAIEWTGSDLKSMRLRNGVVLNAPTAINLAFLFHEIWVNEIYTPPGYKIHSGDVVIDVGANIGVFATFAATRAPGVTVHAYEPFQDCVDWLQRNVEESGLRNVHVHKAAVSGAPGEAQLQVDPSRWIVNSLFNGRGKGESITVNCLGLNDVMEENGITLCDLLKLDCEGSEYEVLKGCTPATLKRVRRIVGEYHERPAINGSGQELCSFLKLNSFRIDRFEQTGEDCGIICATNIAL